MRGKEIKMKITKTEIKKMVALRDTAKELLRIVDGDDGGLEDSKLDWDFSIESKRHIDMFAKSFKSAKQEFGEIRCWLWVGQDCSETFADVRKKFGVSGRQFSKLRKLGIIVEDFMDDGTFHVVLDGDKVHDFLLTVPSDQEMQAIHDDISKSISDIELKLSKLELLKVWFD